MCALGVILSCSSASPKSSLLPLQVPLRVRKNYKMSVTSKPYMAFVKMKFWLCKTKHRVHLVLELCDYIHIVAEQLKVQKMLGNDSQHQYHSWQSGYL